MTKRKTITSKVKIMKGKFKTRLKGYEGNQYHQFYDDKLKKWVWTHRRTARNKYKLEKIPKGFVVHHIDRVTTNNKKDNLIILHEKDHKKLHKEGRLELLK